MTMTRISERREVLTYPSEDGAVGYIGVWVDDVQVAAAVRQDDSYAERNNGARWALWSSGLRLRLRSDTDAASPISACPLPVDDEHDARAWLDLLADIAEGGPRAVETRTLP